MEDLIKRIVQSIVDQPERVEIKKIEGDRTTVYELSVAKEDMGKIIGKRGQNIQAIRSIVFGASAKQKKRCVLELIE